MPPDLPETETPRARDSRQRLVIVGFGMVAFKFLQRLSVTGALDRYEATVIGEERYPAYDRIHLTEWLEHRDFNLLDLARRGSDGAPGIEALTGDAVTAIDRDRRRVLTAAGRPVRYDRLVLATGAAAFRPPIEGANLDGVFVYRTFDDLEAIRERSGAVRDAIVVGGGLLGIEIAEALHREGLGVTLLESGPYLLKRQLDPQTAAQLQLNLHGKGIPTVTEARARRIERRGEDLVLTVSGTDRAFAAGMIVMAAGVRPRDELARAAGLNVHERGGIVVDDALRTSDPVIHAIGDCACHGGVAYGLVAPGYRMSETLAEILAGGKRRFSGYVPAVRLRLSGIDVWALGKPDERGVRVNFNDNGSSRRITVRAKRVRAAAAVGPWQEIGHIQDMIRNQRRPSPAELHQFIRTGTFTAPDSALPVTEWPESAMVCNCLEVTRGELGAACGAGCTTAEALAQATGASTVCGSCREMLAELAGAEASGARPFRWADILTGAAAVLLALIVAAAEPIAPAASVESGGIWDTLYRSGGWRQATGYGLLGCVLAGSAAYSLRKRWRRLRWGSIDAWRIGHSALAVVALAALVAHTGLRLGNGFDRVVMVFFLAAAVLGAAAAAGYGGARSRTTYWLHALAVWPLPVLVLFHVLSTYYF